MDYSCLYRNQAYGCDHCVQVGRAPVQNSGVVIWNERPNMIGRQSLRGVTLMRIRDSVEGIYHQLNIRKLKRVAGLSTDNET